MQFRKPIGAPLLALLAAGVLRADDPELQMAPPNPDFVKWQERERQREARAAGPQAPDEGARRLGFVPPPFRYPDAPAMAAGAEAIARPSVGAYPGSFDLRTQDVLSPVRNQNPFGTCWSFASYASLESNIRKTAGTSFDFSEWHTAWFAYNPANGMPAFTKRTAAYGGDQTFDQGGSGTMFTAVVARGTGPVHEALAPYQNTRSYPQSSLPNGREPKTAVVIGSVYSFQKCDRDTIKGLVQANGALATSMLWPEEDESAHYNSTTKAFRRVQDSDFSSNHLVSIVGWDNSFSKDKFPAANRPAADGAWIVRNSWGPNWGDGGYFYMSYDTTTEYFNSFIGALEFDTKTYQYDHLGMVNSLGYGSDTVWFSNVFTATGDDPVTDVAFYARAANASYEISVRTGVGADPSTGALALASQKGGLGMPGYHRVKLSAPVNVASGQRFAVIVKLTTPSYRYPMSIHYPYQGYSDGATALPGVGFTSPNGTSWSDVKSIPSLGVDNVSVCLKAFSAWAAPDGGRSKNPQLLGFGSAYGGSDLRYDLNGDGRVDDKDLQELFTRMGW